MSDVIAFKVDVQVDATVTKAADVEAKENQE